MKYIQKLEAPDFFIQETQNLVIWNDYTKKQGLKKHILQKEQFWLCCYCEKKLTLEGISSHVEHIKPKGKEEYKDLMFLYANLVVSCQGNTYNEEGSNSQNTCGHKKDNNFNESLFLDPTLETEIRNYFRYDDNGTIKPSDIQPEKSEHTIKQLNLNGNNGLLAEARKKSLIALRESIKKLKLPVADRKKKIKSILDKESHEYISFLRYRLLPLVAD